MLSLIALLCGGADRIGLPAGRDPLAATDGFLAVDEAFALSARIEGNRIVAYWTIAEGYYLYRHGFAMSADDALGEVVVPAGETIVDDYFGATEVYRGGVEVHADLAVGTALPVVVRIGYQGCAEAGFCYPPQLRTMSFDDMGHGREAHLP